MFERTSRYPYPRAKVFAWHTRPGAFARLSPPRDGHRAEAARDGINVGSEAELLISHPLVAGLLPDIPRPGARKGAPIGVRWLVRHVELVPNERFVDEQVRGPFRNLSATSTTSPTAPVGRRSS